MKSLRRLHSVAAFTLLEIMLVVMIIALLAGSAIYMMRGNVDIAKITRSKADIEGIVTQVQLYESLTRSLPSTADGLQALTQRPKGSPVFREGVPKDPWNQEYILENPGRRNKRGNKGFDIFSAGPDKMPNTDDDIGNWDDEPSQK